MGNNDYNKDNNNNRAYLSITYFGLITTQNTYTHKHIKPPKPNFDINNIIIEIHQNFRN